MNRTTRLLIGGAVSAALFGVFAAPASAHVTVNSPDAQQGGRAVLTFRVPTEVDNASTVTLRVQMPTDSPIVSASVKPHPGWTHTVETTQLDPPVQGENGEITEAVSVVEWDADSPDTGIQPGEYDEFEVNVNPLPETETVAFKVVQTYSDGTEVAWIQEPAADGAEPEHPAPSLTLAAADSSDTEGGSEAAADVDPADDGTQPASNEADAPSKGSVTLATILGIVGIVVGLAGVAFGFTARRSRSPEETKA